MRKRTKKLARRDKRNRRFASEMLETRIALTASSLEIPTQQIAEVSAQDWAMVASLDAPTPLIETVVNGAQANCHPPSAGMNAQMLDAQSQTTIGEQTTDESVDPVDPTDDEFSNSNPISIAADVPNIATSQITISSLSESISDIDVEVDIEHTYVSDLMLTLIAPDGTRVPLADRVGGGDDNFTNTLFDDEATASVENASAPFTGSFKPSGSLADLDGMSPNGLWTLEIHDVAHQDGGTLNRWRLNITTDESVDPIDPVDPVDPIGPVDFASLTPDQLVEVVTTRHYDDLQGLWDLDQSVRSVLTHSHMEAVLQEIESSSANSQNLRELFFFVRVGYYHGFYDNDINFDSLQSETAQSLTWFSETPQLNAHHDQSANVLSEWLLAVDGSENWGSFTDTFVTVLRDFLDEPERQEDYVQQVNAYDIITTVFGRGKHSPGSFNRELVDVLREFAVMTNPNEDLAPLVNNAIWSLGHAADTDFDHGPVQAVALSHLTEAMDVHASDTIQFLTAVKAMDAFAGGQNARGETVTLDAYRDELEAALFPNTLNFSDSDTNLIIRTSVSEQRAASMFDAVQDLELQFFELIGGSTPVADDPNETLTVVLYDNPDDYGDFQPLLFDLDSDNGGIYIEQDGVFYTYDRTPDQSIFSLGELFRHEYSHYLIGRYIVDGLWGEEPIYEDSRMTWFDEGFAEFLVGSSVENGVQPRPTLVEEIAADSSERMTVDQILHSSYDDGFGFYSYAGLFFNYMHTEAPSELDAIIDFARAGDVQGFDGWVERMSNSSALERQFQSYLDRLVADADSLDDPGFVGSVQFDSVQYAPGDLVTVTVVDDDLFGQGTIQAEVRSGTDTETVTLFEQNGGVFSSTLPTDLGPSDVDNGVLTLAGELTASYLDRATPNGTSVDRTAVAEVSPDELETLARDAIFADDDLEDLLFLPSIL